MHDFFIYYDQTGKLTIKKIKGVPYVYFEYNRVYYKEKKYNSAKRIYIDKKCPDSSGKMDAGEALSLYKSRYTSEKLFCGDKSYLGNSAERVYSVESIDTKVFIAFAALIIRNRIYTRLMRY